MIGLKSRKRIKTQQQPNVANTAKTKKRKKTPTPTHIIPFGAAVEVRQHDNQLEEKRVFVVGSCGALKSCLALAGFEQRPFEKSEMKCVRNEETVLK